MMTEPRKRQTLNLFLSSVFSDPTRARLGRRAVAGLTCLALLAGLAFPAVAAVDADDLLPVDEAFAVDARASDHGAVAIHWKIADGYYLYRHRTSVTSDAGFAAGELQLPPGEPHEDEFFGKVETYRKRLTAQLPGDALGASTTLTVKYQGCADAGICYPPQTRKLTVALPSVPPARPPAASKGTNLLGKPLASSGLGGNALFPGAAGGADAMPLPAEQAFGFEAIAGDGDTLLLRFSPASGYYLYRDNTRLTLESADGGIALGKPRWPTGRQHRDEHFGDVVVYFDQIDVPVPLLRERADAATVKLTATFQGCQNDGICYPPMTRKVAIDLPKGTVTATTKPAADTAGTTSAAAAAGDATGTQTHGAAGQLPGAGETDATVAGSEGTPGGTLATDDASDANDAGVARLTPPEASTISGAAAPDSAPGLLLILLFALIGGLILNLMPCVLPVLSLKVLSLAGNGHTPGAARKQALWYTAGVMVSFAALGALALGLRQAGLALGWGFQLQQPIVVALLALLMLALGLSLSGVWQLTGRFTGAGHGLTTRSGPAGDFFTGVLAVVVATPCTAPFMGAALAWAFTAPAAIALAVFLALGLGLALRFLLIGFVPALARALPRPGAWMETFKQIMAFPLYLTAVWLAWVLAKQLGADAVGLWMVAAVLVALGAWAWNHSRVNLRPWATSLAVIALLGAGWTLWLIHTHPLPEKVLERTAVGEDQLVKVPFSEQRLADLRAANRVVFVNMTADWCVTCKANEKTVLGREGFKRALDDADAAYLVGDWTNVDPTLTAFLQRHNAVGVPLYVVFPRGGGEGQILPTVLTPDIVRKALADAAVEAF
ncbi:protein-disulfide reductase DsbD [Lysobacter sp. A03]|uniref:protein-disulfide reductase DsbD family protein n=1 Tax=Lysobacter sp. A03 TaxID=1199154 RepID=UPI0005B6F845|nr:protein-disulfide reductase DsbD [Lysobacter sp. A03]KIQ96361.1 Cytochrome c-type biogenesis protein DsbD, protein-disulfide reductase [Lysobacter sp. A03]